MECPHCGVNFHDMWSNGPLGEGALAPASQYGPGYYWFQRVTVCPSCKSIAVDMFAFNMSNRHAQDPIRIFPNRSIPKPVHQSVPANIKDDYLEAFEVLATSARASAALSRRCLQAMLRDRGYKAKDLAAEIQLLLDEPDPKRAINYKARRSVDQIRGFGNFAAHPIINKASLEIIDVEPHEAEWCLETILELFDHFYIGPWEADRRSSELDAKLGRAGKPPSKS